MRARSDAGVHHEHTHDAGGRGVAQAGRSGGRLALSVIPDQIGDPPSPPLLQPGRKGPRIAGDEAGGRRVILVNRSEALPPYRRRSSRLGLRRQSQ
jgi:hypothetical protein